MEFKTKYQYGKQSEKDSLKDLQNFFCQDLRHDPQKYAHFDFVSDKCMVELKSRRDSSLSYDEKTKRIVFAGKRSGPDDLLFDKVKLDFVQNCQRMYPNDDREYYIVWKIDGRYFKWKVEFNDENKDIYHYWIPEKMEKVQREDGNDYRVKVVRVFIENIQECIIADS